MKILTVSLVFHILCIFLFGIIYISLNDKFMHHHTNEKSDFSEYLLLSTTIQSGIGYSNLYPVHETVRWIIMMQQIITITTNIVTIYFFV